MTSRRRAALVACAVGGLVVAGLAAWWLASSGDDGSAPADTSAADAAEATTTTTALVGQPGSPGLGDPYFPGLGNGGYDVQHYTLALTWQPDAGSIAGSTTIEATATQDLSRFNLDLVGLEVSSVVVDGSAAATARSGRELEVAPRTAIPSGASFTVTVAYSGVPTPVSEGTELFDVGWQTDGREAYVVSEPSGAATFFPANDHPSDKATYRFEITAPADQVVAASGVLTAQRDEPDGTKVWTYEARDPMASYLAQLAIGDFVLVDREPFGNVRIRHALHRSFSDSAADVASRTAEMIDVLDDVFGPFPFEVYGVVAVDEPLGFALETQTLTIIGSDIARAGRRADRVMVHELAHQWVGNTVSPATWKDIWLNEGFATYSEWLWAERTGGVSAAASARDAAGIRADLDIPPGDPGSGELFETSVYVRGAMTLQALREAIGDDAFFTVLRQWVDENRDASAATADFIALAERVSGQQLDDLFLAWLYGPSLPRLAPRS
ncbi:MAG: M1 family metallopeptidase [Actinomycetota bacterium]